jgi:hypothetical protein
MKHHLLAAVLIALPSLAAAQSQLERLQTTSETMSTDMFVLMANEITANGGDPAPIIAAIPDMSWDAEMRAAGECMLEQYTQIIGRSGVDEMLDTMEDIAVEVAAMAEAGGTTSQMADTTDMMPEGLSASDSIRITQDCGMMEIQMRRMEESGFNAAMMQAMQ